MKTHLIQRQFVLKHLFSEHLVFKRFILNHSILKRLCLNRFLHLLAVFVSVVALDAICILPFPSVMAEVISVDVYEWATISNGVTSTGWTVRSMDAYKDTEDARFDTKDDQALSPIFPGVVTQLVLNVKSSNESMTRFLTAVPVGASDSASNLVLQPSTSYAKQALTWSPEYGVRQFYLQIAIGSKNGSWGVRSLDVYIDRGIEAPIVLDPEQPMSKSLVLNWGTDPRAVSNEVEFLQIVPQPPTYNALYTWDFSTLTNASGSSSSFDQLPHDASLNNVTGEKLNLQGKAGGYLQIGNSDKSGVMILPLPHGTGRKALMTMFRHEKDDPTSAQIATIESNVTNEFTQFVLTVHPHFFETDLPDTAEKLAIIGPRGRHRIRVRDVAIGTDYVPGNAITNLICSKMTTLNSCKVSKLATGDYIYRIRSFNAEGTDSAWTDFQTVIFDTRNVRDPGTYFSIR